MPKGVYTRSCAEKERITKQILAIKPKALRGVPKTNRETGVPIKLGAEEKAEALRAARNRYSRTPKGRFDHLKNLAKQFNREVGITCEELENFRQEYDFCMYCGGELPTCGHGLDRMDNSRGYIKDNVATCCSSCNRIKGRLEGLGFKFPRSVELLKEILSMEVIQ